jgi:hypothetical protein
MEALSFTGIPRGVYIGVGDSSPTPVNTAAAYLAFSELTETLMLWHPVDGDWKYIKTGVPSLVELISVNIPAGSFKRYTHFQAGSPADVVGVRGMVGVLHNDVPTEEPDVYAWREDWVINVGMVYNSLGVYLGYNIHLTFPDYAVGPVQVAVKYI